MDIYMIWVKYSDGTLTLVDAWDDDTVMENPEGWQERLDHALTSSASGRRDDVRVVKTSVNFDAVRSAFEIPTV